jgi:class 3 adenylate cyclase
MQTVNTAARMESNGERNRVHVSEKTAELIKLAGKEYVAFHLIVFNTTHTDLILQSLISGQ